MHFSFDLSPLAGPGSDKRGSLCDGGTLPPSMRMNIISWVEGASLLNKFTGTIAVKQAKYRHMKSHMTSHVQSALFGSETETFSWCDGRAVRAYARIYCCDEVMPSFDVRGRVQGVCAGRFESFE